MERANVTKIYEKFLTPEFAAYNVHQEPKDLKDVNVLKMLAAFTKLRKNLKQNGFNVGRMYAMPSIMYAKDSGIYFGKLETDGECAVWMIREHLPTVRNGVDGADWDMGSYYWDTGIYCPPGVMVTLDISAS